ncbi:MAG: protein kinase [Gemmatimonadaceae bacterium]
MPYALDTLREALAGRYLIERELGHGGMATVYLAHDVRHRRSVALKVLHAPLASAVGAERFLREIAIAAALTHPHVLPLHDSGEADGSLYYVMPFVEGESLRERLQREKHVPVSVALRIAREVADALAYAHEHGVVHRDVKPENILLEAGHAVVADFGIAHAVSAAADERLTQTGLAIGTAAYMSPEQAAGEREIDGRSDVYSLGCVLYEMLAGRPPFSGETPQAVALRRLHADPAPLAEVAPEVPASVADVVERALARDPNERFASASELAAALDAAARAVEPAPAARQRRRLGRRLRFWRRLRRVNRRAGVAGAALLGAVLVASAWLLRDAIRARGASGAPTRIAVLPFTVRGSTDVRYLGEGMVDLLSTNLDGAGALRSVDAHAILSAAASLGPVPLDVRMGRLLAERLGAGLYVLGSIFEARGRLRIMALLYDRQQPVEAVAQASVEGGSDQIFALVDELTAELLAEHHGGRAGRLARLAAVTTSSLPALKAYLEGEGALRAGRSDRAMDAFQRAVAADSTFALAHYRLAVASNWFSAYEPARRAAERAVQLSGRLGEHDRLLLNAFLAWQRGSADESERLYRAILKAYPDDVEAWYQLGEVLFHYNPVRGRSILEAREPFERALFYDPKYGGETVFHLLDLAGKERRDATFDSLLARLEPESELTLAWRTMRAFARRDSVAHMVERVRRSGEVALTVSVWDVAVLSHDIEGGERLARLLVEPTRAPPLQAAGRLKLAHLAFARGRWRDARAQLAALGAVHPPSALEYQALFATAPFVALSRATLDSMRAALIRWDASSVPVGGVFAEHDSLHPQLRAYLLGRLSAKLGEPEATVRYADTLERLPSPSHGRELARDLARGLRALTAQANGRHGDALRLLEGARRETRLELLIPSSFHSQAFERFLRAELLREQRRDDEALAWYGVLGENSLEELIYFAPARLGRAEIYARRGDRKRAAAEYARAAALWQGADPEVQATLVGAAQRLGRR